MCAITAPETFTDPAEVTYLSLADCRLITLPDKIGWFSPSFFPFLIFGPYRCVAASFENVTKLDLSLNKLNSGIVSTIIKRNKNLEHVKYPSFFFFFF